MFVLRPTSGLYSQPVWQQPTYEPFSAFLVPQHASRPQQPSRLSQPTRRSCYYPSTAASSYLPSAALYDDGCYDDDAADDDELTDSVSFAPHIYQRSRYAPSMEELLLARLQEQRRQEAEEAERMHRTRVLRERQRQQLEQQLMAERQRRAAVLRQQEQARRQQQARQAEADRQRREQQQAEQYAQRLQDALSQLLLGGQLAEDEAEQVERRERPAVGLLMRNSERPQPEQSKKAVTPNPRQEGAARPASPAPATASRLPHQLASNKPSSSPKPTSSDASPRPTIRIRTIPISSSSSPSSASAPTSPMPTSVPVQQYPASASATANSTKRPAAPFITITSPTTPTTMTATTTTGTTPPIRRGSVVIEDVPSSPDRLKVDADEDVWAVEKRLHTPTPTTSATNSSATAVPTAA